MDQLHGEIDAPNLLDREWRSADVLVEQTPQVPGRHPHPFRKPFDVSID